MLSPFQNKLPKIVPFLRQSYHNNVLENLIRRKILLSSKGVVDCTLNQRKVREFFNKSNENIGKEKNSL